MRRRDLPAEVEIGPRGPAAVKAGGRAWKVRRVLDDWRVGGRWWLGETPRTHYRVELEDGRAIELVEPDEGAAGGAGGWRVSRESD